MLEYLNEVQSRLPAQARTSLGPDATGVGWVYEYALIDGSGKMDLSQLRALRDWFLKYELKTVPNVSEVASVGGMVRQYQIVLYPRPHAGFQHYPYESDGSSAAGQPGDMRLGAGAR